MFYKFTMTLYIKKILPYIAGCLATWIMPLATSSPIYLRMFAPVNQSPGFQIDSFYRHFH